MKIKQLPYDILKQIFLFLTLKYNCRTICKKFREIYYDIPVKWYINERCYLYNNFHLYHLLLLEDFIQKQQIDIMKYINITSQEIYIPSNEYVKRIQFIFNRNNITKTSLEEIQNDGHFSTGFMPSLRILELENALPNDLNMMPYITKLCLYNILDVINIDPLQHLDELCISNSSVVNGAKCLQNIAKLTCINPIDLNKCRETIYLSLNITYLKIHLGNEKMFDILPYPLQFTKLETLDLHGQIYFSLFSGNIKNLYLRENNVFNLLLPNLINLYRLVIINNGLNIILYLDRYPKLKILNTTGNVQIYNGKYLDQLTEYIAN